MIIQCENCKRKFKVDPGRIKPEGSKVRCSKCGHIFMAMRDPSGPGTEDLPVTSAPKDVPPPAPESPPLGKESEPPADEMLDIELDRAPKDEGNWEEFVNITKTGTESAENETKEEASEGEGDFSWGRINIDDEPEGASSGIPEMFEDEEPEEEPPQETRASEPPPDQGVDPGVYSRQSEREMLVLDDEPRHQTDDFEGYYGKASEGTTHRGAYMSQRPKKSILGKLLSTLMIAAVFVIIIIASLTILINLELIPEEQVTRAKTLVESVLPVKLTPEKAESIIITQHGGSWVSTRYGPLYVVSGMIKNVSGAPVHYIQLRSEFVAAGQTLYEDTIYAGNTFTEKELKLSRTEDVVFKLKKKNGDIDYYNTQKLSGRNYDIQPGESVPFFAVFPSDTTVLGLKYNLEIIGYEGPRVN